MLKLTLLFEICFTSFFKNQK